MNGLALLAICLVVVGMFYLLPALQLKSTYRAPARLRLVPVPREQVPPQFLRLLDPPVAALGKLGFVVTGYLDGPSEPAQRAGIRYTVLLRTGDGETGAVVYAIERAVLGLSASVEFFTKFGDGGEVDTSNSDQPTLFRHPPRKRVYHFPSEPSVTSLYDLHRRLVVRGGTRSMITLQAPTLDEGVQRLQDAAAKDMAWQVEAGDYVPSPDGGYQLTWQGVVRAIAILGPGLKTVRQAQQRRRGRALAAELRGS
jgi:hypothetical protein